MNAGKLRKRLSFQRKLTTTNSVGEQVAGWQEYYTCYGSVDVLRGQLIYQTGDFISQATYTIGIRYPKGVEISVADRIVCEGHLFEVQAVLNKELRNRELQILAYVINQKE